jgi:hypothetical protein
MVRTLTLLFAPGDALVDEHGDIRSFTVEWEGNNGVVSHYKLLPKHSTANQIATYIIDFLGGYGLSRIGANIFKGTRQVDHITRYTVGTGATHVMQSFIKHHFLPDALGYYNLVTEKLIFPHGAFRAPDGTY